MARCLLCNQKIKPPKKKFCCNKHKDRWHNINNPRGIFSYLNDSPNYKEELDMDDIHDLEHPFSGEALGQDY